MWQKGGEMEWINVLLTRNSCLSIFGDKHKAIISYINCRSLPENQMDIKARGKLDSIQTTFELTLTLRYINQSRSSLFLQTQLPDDRKAVFETSILTVTMQLAWLS